MATNPIVRYAVDKTGVNLNNRVQGEIVNLSGTGVRAFSLQYGAYFADSLVLVDAATGTQLVRGIHYKCVELLKEASIECGKEICYVILIIDGNLTGQIIAQYQVLGGTYEYNVSSALEIYKALTSLPQTIDWVDVLNKNFEYPPTDHLHDIADTYGWEKIVDVLVKIKDAILLGNDSSLNEVYKYYDGLYSALNANVEVLNLGLNQAQAAIENNQYRVGDVLFSSFSAPNANWVTASGSLVARGMYPELERMTGDISLSLPSYISDTKPVIYSLACTGFESVVTSLTSSKIFAISDARANVVLGSGNTNELNRCTIITKPVISNSLTTSNGGIYSAGVYNSILGSAYGTTYYYLIDTPTVPQLYKSVNDSVTGASTPSAFTSGFTASQILALSSTWIIVGSAEGDVKISTDSGDTYTTVSPGMLGAVVYMTRCEQSTVYFYASVNGKIRKADINSPSLYSIVDLPSGANVYSLCAATGAKFIAAGSAHGIVYTSIDDGVTWVSHDYSSLLGDVNVDYVKLSRSNPPTMVLANKATVPVKMVFVDSARNVTSLIKPLHSFKDSDEDKLINSEYYFCTNSGKMLPGIEVDASVTTDNVMQTSVRSISHANGRMIMVGDAGSVMQGSIHADASTYSGLPGGVSYPSIDFHCVRPYKKNLILAGSANTAVLFDTSLMTASTFNIGVGSSTDIIRCFTTNHDDLMLFAGTGNVIKRSIRSGAAFKTVVVPNMVTSTGQIYGSGGTNPNINDLVMVENVIVGVGDYGNIIRSSDGGMTWDVLTSPVGVGVNLLSICAVRSRIYAVGTQKTILTSDDYGLSWSSISSLAPAGTTFNCVASYADGCVIGTEGHGLLVSLDGVSTVMLNDGIYSNLSTQSIKAVMHAPFNVTCSIFAATSTQCHKVIYAPIHYTSHFDPEIACTAFKSANGTAIFGDNKGNVYRTSDFYTFTKISIGSYMDRETFTDPHPGWYYSQVTSIDTSWTGQWVVCFDRFGFLYSNDDGLTWTYYASVTAVSFVTYDMYNAKFFICTRPGIAYTFTNPSVLVSAGAFSSEGGILSLASHGGRIYASTASGKMYYTDNSLTYAAVSMPEKVYGLHCMNSKVFCTAGNKVYISSDGGDTWTSKIVTNSTVFLHGITSTQTGLLMVYGLGGALYLSSDEGLSWNIATTKLYNQDIYCAFEHNNILYVGHKGYYDSEFSSSTPESPCRSSRYGILSQVHTADFDPSVHYRLPVIDMTNSYGVSAYILAA